MHSCTSLCDKVSEIDSKLNFTEQSINSITAIPYSECDSDMNESTTLNDSLCDTKFNLDSESSTTTLSLESSKSFTGHDSQPDTIIDLDLKQKCPSSATKWILDQQICTASDATLGESLNKQSLKHVKMKKASWYYTDDFDLRSVFNAPVSNIKICPLDPKQVNYPHQCNHVDLKTDLRNDPVFDFDLRSVLSGPSPLKSTSESVLDVESGILINYKEKLLESKQANNRPLCDPVKNGNHYNPEFDLRSVRNESSSPKPTSESVLNVESGILNYKENLLVSKKINNNHPLCDPVKIGYRYDPNLDLRSVLFESSLPKAYFENDHGFQSGINYKVSSPENKQAINCPQFLQMKYDVHSVPDFDLRSILNESSPKATPESLLDSESEIKYKVNQSKSKLTDNNFLCDPSFDLRYVLNARKSDMTSEECAMTQCIIMKSKNKLIQKYRDRTEVNHINFFHQRNKETLKHKKRHRDFQRKRIVEEITMGDIFYPIQQEFIDPDKTPSSIVEFLKRMRKESDKRKELKSPPSLT